MVLFLVLVPFVSLFIGCTEIQITVYTDLYSFCVFLKKDRPETSNLVITHTYGSCGTASPSPAAAADSESSSAKTSYANVY